MIGYWLRRVVLLCLLVVFQFESARAEERLALILGNSGYTTVPSLDNPVNDAALIAKTLEQLGFHVTLATNLGQVGMKRAIAQFGRDLRAAGDDATGLFYYAGHGVQSFGNNYLLPVDVDLADAADLDLMAVEAQSVLRQMASARNRTNIVILDACRNNPFEAIPDLNESGLAEMKAPTGTFLAYATAPGGVALDGLASNSPFTLAVSEQVQIPGVPIEQAFKEVRRQVIAQSQGQQTPWDTSSLVSDFIFVAAPEEPKLTAAETEELQVWRTVEASRDPVQLMLFLRGYPEGRFASAARDLLAEVLEAELSGNKPEPAQPSEEEQAMFAAVQADGSAAAYQGYLQVYPEGTYAEMARIEIAALSEGQGQDPASDGKALQQEQVAVVEPDTKPQVEAGPVTFESTFETDVPQLAGRSLSDLTGLSPLFPPVEGLPESYWKDQTCNNCHQWNRDRLCTQANSYLSLTMQRSLSKQHPFGGVVKQALRSWAAGGCL